MSSLQFWPYLVTPLDAMFPHDVEVVAHFDDAVAIAKSPNELFYAVLCGNSIVILDARDRTFPEIASLETSKDIKNHWILWPSQNRIFYGTYTGKLFVAHFTGDSFESAPVERSVSSVITSVFVTSDSQVGVVLTGPKLVFLDANGVTQSSVVLDKRFGIVKNAWCVEKGVIGFEANGDWWIYDLNSRAIRKVDVSGCVKCFGSVDECVCVTANGVVYSYNGSKKVADEIMKCECTIEACHRVSKNVIGALGFGGKVFTYDSLLKRVFVKCFDVIGGVSSSFFDVSGSRLVFLNVNGDVMSLNFFRIFPPFLVTGSRVERVEGGQVVAEVPDFRGPLARNVRSIPLELYPLQSVVANSDSYCCIVGHCGIAVFTEYSLFFDPTPIAHRVVWINNMVCVIDQSGTLVLYTDELLKIGEMKLAKRPTSVHANGTKLLLTAGNDLTVLQFGLKGQAKIGSIDVAVRSLSVNYPIISAFLMWNDSILLEKDDSVLVNMTTGKVVWKHCDFLWSGNEPSAIFSIREDHGVTVLTETKSARFPNVRSAWSWKTKIYDVTSDLIIQSIDFESRLIPIGSLEPNEICKAMQAMVGRDDFKEAFLQLLDQDPDYTDLATALRQIDMSLVPQFLDLMTDSVVEKLSNTGFDFTPFFGQVKPSIQSRILSRIQPRFFNLLIEQHQSLLESKEDRFKRFVVSQCIERQTFLRGLAVARASNVSFVQALEGTKLVTWSLADCLKSIRADAVAWNCEGKFEQLSVLARTFQTANLFNWALAGFLVLKNEDCITALLTNEPYAIMHALSFTRENAQDESSVLLRSLDMGL